MPVLLFSNIAGPFLRHSVVPRVRREEGRRRRVQAPVRGQGVGGRVRDNQRLHVQVGLVRRPRHTQCPGRQLLRHVEVLGGWESGRLWLYATIIHGVLGGIAIVDFLLAPSFGPRIAPVLTRVSN